MRLSHQMSSGSPPRCNPATFQNFRSPSSPNRKAATAVAYARLYLPGSTRAWYPSAFDGHDLFFGLVVEAEIDFDYFSLTDLHHLHNAEGRGVQLDHRYTPRPLGELQTAYERLFNQLTGGQ